MLLYSLKWWVAQGHFAVCTIKNHLQLNPVSYHFWHNKSWATPIKEIMRSISIELDLSNPKYIETIPPNSFLELWISLGDLIRSSIMQFNSFKEYYFWNFWLPPVNPLTPMCTSVHAYVLHCRCISLFELDAGDRVGFCEIVSSLSTIAFQENNWSCI